MTYLDALFIVHTERMRELEERLGVVSLFNARMFAKSLVEERLGRLTVREAREGLIEECDYTRHRRGTDPYAAAWLYIALIQYGPEKGSETVKRECDALRAAGWNENRYRIRESVLRQMFELLTEYDEPAWLPFLQDTVGLEWEELRSKTYAQGRQTTLLHYAAAVYARIDGITIGDDGDLDRLWLPTCRVEVLPGNDGFSARLFYQPDGHFETHGRTEAEAVARLGEANGWRLVPLRGDRYVALPPTPAD